MEKREERIGLVLSNHYGRVMIGYDPDKDQYYAELDDWDDMTYSPISKELYELMKKELILDWDEEDDEDDEE